LGRIFWEALGVALSKTKKTLDVVSKGSSNVTFTVVSMSINYILSTKQNDDVAA
jgi:hypothetical protein